MKKTAILLWILVLILGFSSQSWCLTYSATDILNHTTPGAIVTSGTTMSTKTTNIGTIGVGTLDGVPGEIDNAPVGSGSGEWIRIAFATPQIIDNIQVAFLYPASGGYGDVVNEMAGFIADGAGFTLQAVGPTTALWDGVPGIASNLEMAQAPAGGVWEISNPFPGPVTYIEFRALILGPGGSTDSDYSIVSVSIPSVPEPTTMLLLGLGLVGLAAVKRKIA